MLLRLLNSRFLCGGPMYYGLVNGLEAVSYESLKSEERQQPGITVRELIEVIDGFNTCPIYAGLAVIEEGKVREGTIWDVHDLRNSLSRAAQPVGTAKPESEKEGEL